MTHPAPGPSASTARLVILTADGLEHRYVANRLCAELPVAAVVVDTLHRPPRLRRAFRGGVVRGLGRTALFAFRKAVADHRARDRALANVLGAEAVEGFAADDRVIRVAGINSPEAHAAVSALRPSALLVYGTVIVRDDMLERAQDVAFNLHTGMSPRYRGTECTSWPLVNGEPEWVGVTVHECKAAVDGGPIFACARSPIEPGDGIHEVFARAVAEGAERYVEIVRQYLHGDLDGQPQDLATGTEYRGYQWTLLHEVRARRALARLGRAARGSTVTAAS
jgi:methionyl-tRNA formyltransferase